MNCCIYEYLGELPTGKIESEARAASGDGSVIVGDSKVEDPNDTSQDAKQASLWEDYVMTRRGFPADAAGPFESKATGVSGDGSVVVGESKTDAGKEPFVWAAESNQMRSPPRGFCQSR